MPNAEKFAEYFWESAAMSSKDADFARQVLQAFANAGHHTDQEVGQAGGPSTSWMTTLRKVARGELPKFESKPRGDTLKRIDTAANWRKGSARELLWSGTAPELADPSRYVETVTASYHDDGLGQWLTRAEADMTVEEREEMWAQVQPVLEAVKAQVLRNRQRGSHLGDTSGTTTPTG